VPQGSQTGTLLLQQIRLVKCGGDWGWHPLCWQVRHQPSYDHTHQLWEWKWWKPLIHCYGMSPAPQAGASTLHVYWCKWVFFSLSSSSYQQWSYWVVFVLQNLFFCLFVLTFSMTKNSLCALALFNVKVRSLESLFFHLLRDDRFPLLLFCWNCTGEEQNCVLLYWNFDV
jgi:hypothetical protein